MNLSSPLPPPMISATRMLSLLGLLTAALLAFTSCSSPTPPPPEGSARIAYTKGVPGGVIVQTLRTTATVMAIDRSARAATLRAADGRTFTVQVGPEAVNFDEVRVGDRVSAAVTQKVVAYLERQDRPAVDATAVVVAGAARGDQPAALAAETIQITGRIIAVDSARRTATLRFEDGITHTLPLREDVSADSVKVGDLAVFRVTEMVAISVEKAR